MDSRPAAGASRPKVEPLASHHDRAAFSCGTPDLDAYIWRYARQDARRDLSRCFVLVPHAGSREIIGYYTLSNYGIQITALPADLARRLPSNILLPATLLGRLAVDGRYQAYGYGKLLLVHALRAALRTAHRVASLGVVVDARTDDLVPFYTKRGFVALHDRPRHLIVPMNRIRAMFPDDVAGLPDVSDVIEAAAEMADLIDSAQTSLLALNPAEVSERVQEIVAELQRRLEAFRRAP